MNLRSGFSSGRLSQESHNQKVVMNNALSWFRRQSAPVTVSIIGVLIIGTLLSWAIPSLAANLIFASKDVFSRPWSLLTYPFVNGILGSAVGPIFFVFLVIWLFQIGGQVERSHGGRNFGILWLIISVISVVPLLLVGASAAGTLIPVACLTVMWATRMPNSQVLLFGMLPIAAKWIGVLSVLGVFFSYASSGAMVLPGLLACTSCGLAFLYASNRIPKLNYGLGYGSFAQQKPTKEQLRREREFEDDVKRRKQEREERERLRKLFESSLEDK